VTVRAPASAPDRALRILGVDPGSRVCGYGVVERVGGEVRYIECGVLTAARINAGYPHAGQLLELDAIAAVVVGGTSLMGGRGSIWGTLVGALLIGELINGLNLLHVEYYSQKIVVGLVLIVAAFLDRFRTEGRR